MTVRNNREKRKALKSARNHNPDNQPTTTPLDVALEEILNDTFDTKDSKLSRDIIVRDIILTAGGKTLLEKTSLSLVYGRRYGLVGYNGCGKTTLMNALYERKNEFSVVPKYMDSLLVEQEVSASSDTCLQSVMASDTTRLKLLAEEERLISLPTLTVEQEDRLNKVYERQIEIGSDQAEARASAILSGLQFNEEQKHWATSEFSGGWRMRISLARALFKKPRLLLLDEPSNHLDLHSVLWLESYLSTWKATLVVVSHDRDFLTAVCTDIVHMWDNKLIQYKGDFSKFDSRFQKRLQLDTDAFNKQHKLLKKQRAKGKKIEESVVILKAPIFYKIMIRFTDAGPSIQNIVSVKDVHFGYVSSREDKGKEALVSPNLVQRDSLFRGVSFGIDTNSRIALVGRNGSGKSTLMKLMYGELKPLSGQVVVQHWARIGVYNQHSTQQLDHELTPVEYLILKFPETDEHVIRKHLGTIGLHGTLHKHKISTLSGGQKSRVALVELQLRKVHLLLLDEPTNHLDVESCDELVKALDKFEGGICVITHNVDLIMQLESEIWICGENANGLLVYDGTFDDYKDELLVEIQEALEEMSDSVTVAK